METRGFALRVRRAGRPDRRGAPIAGSRDPFPGVGRPESGLYANGFRGHKQCALDRPVSAAALALMAMPIAAWCQTPVITSMVNSASYQPTLGLPGTIATIFGTNLATIAATAEAIPLPYQLGGTSVSVGGTAAPLFYVSPTQINFQVPNVASSTVVVSTAVGPSASYDPLTATPEASYAGGIFSLDGTGCGQGAVLNVAADGSVSLNSPANSAAPGDWITFFGSGIAFVDNPPPIGAPAPMSYPITATAPAGAEFDFSLLPRCGRDARSRSRLPTPAARVSMA